MPLNKLTPADAKRRHAYYVKVLNIPYGWRMAQLDNFSKRARIGRVYMPGHNESITWNGKKLVLMTDDEREAMIKRHRARQRRLRAAAEGSPQQ